ncbi:MAG: hypothetical protein OCD00_00740 [Colwellia sp.]
MKKSICLGAAIFIAINSPVSANSLITKGLTALGAVADVDQLISKDEQQSDKPDNGSNIGALFLEQEVFIVGGELDGSTLLLNDLLVSGSNLALIMADQVIELENTDVSDSTIVANIISIKDSNAGYFEIEQLVEFLNSTIEAQSNVQINITSVESSNLIGSDIKQEFYSEGVRYNNTTVIANSFRAK